VKTIAAMDNRDKGSITVLALLVLVILTLIGIGVLTTASSDMETAKNMDIYRRNFARAEAAVRVGMQEIKRIEGLTAYGSLRSCNDATYPWLHTKKGGGNPLPNPDDINASANWVSGGPAAQALDSECLYTVVQTDPPDGDMTKGSYAAYAVYGRSNQNRGEVIIRVGYRVWIPKQT